MILYIFRNSPSESKMANFARLEGEDSHRI